MMKPKFYVGISGHRNIKHSKIEEYKETLKKKLKTTVMQNPQKEVVVLSSLADGADRLIVYAAKELSLRYEIILPMPIEYYEMDFDELSFNEFYQLFIGARSSDVVEMCEGNTFESIATYGNARDLQYQNLGRKMVDKSDMMIFLWDKKENNLIGGTSDIYNYANNKNKSFDEIECERE